MQGIPWCKRLSISGYSRLFFIYSVVMNLSGKLIFEIDNWNQRKMKPQFIQTKWRDIVKYIQDQIGRDRIPLVKWHDQKNIGFFYHRYHIRYVQRHLTWEYKYRSTRKRCTPTFLFILVTRWSRLCIVVLISKQKVSSCTLGIKTSNQINKDHFGVCFTSNLPLYGCK